MHRASDIPELETWSNPPLHLANFKKAIRQAWRRKFGDVCEPCGMKMLFDPKSRGLSKYATLDHILARALGGRDELENITVICKSCNNRKSAEEYRQKNH